MDGKTQAEIATEMGISQSKVSKRRKYLQEILLEYDPDVKKTLHLFKNNSQKMEYFTTLSVGILMEGEKINLSKPETII